MTSASPTFTKPVWQLFDNATVLAEQATQDILNAAESAISQRGAFHLVLAGGTTPKVIYRLLAKTDSDWQHWHVYLGDERCLSPDDAERNSVMASECLLNDVSIPDSQVHFIPSELGSDAAAAAYDKVLQNVGQFDMVLLGMGEDGHTASLFPGHIYPEGPLALPVLNAPKPPPERVSLSSACLSNNDQILILITGQSKHDRVLDWISGVDMPITNITTNNQASVYCDKEAWTGDA
ncbi:6-phosphogluconolactonase [Leucothrix pacifica]|uniref:6-phosphogluconolactonase n=2 Tax=Leucothrix pacifica TaxID=1247513 RepID=A0A317CJI9_9GAMM|nr:6-phosphogluconolactonase [Leucothrix pacifica]